jgi:hypothetical protein
MLMPLLRKPGIVITNKRKMAREISLLNLLISLFLCYVLAACTHSIAVRDIRSIPANEVLVFGEIIATSTKGIVDNYVIFLLDEESKEEVAWPMKKEKYVYWHLRPGKYIITAFQVMNGFGRIWVKFEVPKGYNAVYIGTLRVSLGVISSKVVVDRMDEALATLKEKFSLKEFKVKKSLMSKEEF